MTASPFCHEAFVYGSDDAFATALGPFLAEAVEGGEAAVAVTTSHNISLLRDTIGSRSDAIRWIDARDHYRRPPETIAAYRALVDEALERGAARIRVVGEVEFGTSAAERASWTRYEAALNDVFAATPLWVICPYDRRRLDPDVLTAAAQSHPHLRHPDGVRPSQEFTDPAVLLRELELLDAAPGGRQVTDLPDAGDLRELRRRLLVEARGAGLPPEKVESFVLAVNEVVTNAVLHGRPPIDIRLWTDAGRVVCEVEDRAGGWDDRLAGYVLPDHAFDCEHNRGLWLARCLADDVVIVPRPGATVVRVVQAIR